MKVEAFRHFIQGISSNITDIGIQPQRKKGGRNNYMHQHRGMSVWLRRGPQEVLQDRRISLHIPEI
jgi:hypothetical protein